LLPGYDSQKSEVWSLGCIMWCIYQARLETEWGGNGGAGPLPFGCADELTMGGYVSLLGGARGLAHDIRPLLSKHESSRDWMFLSPELASLLSEAWRLNAHDRPSIDTFITQIARALPPRSSLPSLLDSALGHMGIPQGLIGARSMGHVGGPLGHRRHGAGDRLPSDLCSMDAPMIAACGPSYTFAGDYMTYTLLSEADRPKPGTRHGDPHYGYGTLTPLGDAIAASKQRRPQHRPGARNMPRRPFDTHPTRESLHNPTRPVPGNRPHGPPPPRYIGATY
jgi:hypothetical protein